MADIPWYSTDLARSGAFAARRISDLATTGQHVSTGHFEADPGSQGGQRWIPNPGAKIHYNPVQERYEDENGHPASTGTGNPQTETAPSAMGMLGQAATTPNAQLNPNNNAFLLGAGAEASQMANGMAGRTFGLDQSRAAADVASRSAGAISGAGAGNAQAQNNQFGQTGQDLGVIRASAMGMGPSAAEHLARSQLDSNIRAQSAMAATARGGNIASAMRGAQGAGSQMMLQSQQQIAAQRAQEQLNAQGMLTQGNAAFNNALYGARGQDIGQAVSRAQADQAVGGLQNQIFSTNADLGKFGVGALNNSAALYGTQMGQQTQADQNSRQAYADWLQRQQQLEAGIPVSVGGQMGQVAIANDQAAQQREAALLSAAGAGVAALSNLG